MFKIDRSELKRYMKLDCNIVTKGDEHPIAVYVGCILTHFYDGENIRIFTLGLARRQYLDEIVQQGIKLDINQIVASFIKNQAENNVLDTPRGKP